MLNPYESPQNVKERTVRPNDTIGYGLAASLLVFIGVCVAGFIATRWFLAVKFQNVPREEAYEAMHWDFLLAEHTLMGWFFCCSWLPSPR